MFMVFVAGKMERNKEHVSLLTSQMRDLQTCLREHIHSVTDHTKACCEQNTTWVNTANARTAEKKVSC